MSTFVAFAANGLFAGLAGLFLAVTLGVTPADGVSLKVTLLAFGTALGLVITASAVRLLAQPIASAPVASHSRETPATLGGPSRALWLEHALRTSRHPSHTDHQINELGL